MQWSHCTLCPVACGADRTKTTGFCGCGNTLRAAQATLHFWEEPCISGTHGTGAVFFSGCNLHCCYCQNRSISTEYFGKTISISQLSEILLHFQEIGAESIDLVTGTPHLPLIAESLRAIKHQLKIPVVWNTSGYESVPALRQLEGLVDIYLPDWKYQNNAIAEQYSHVKNYCEVVAAALQEMYRQVGSPVFEGTMLKKGILLRHLVLPGHRHDSIALLRQLAEQFPRDMFLLSLMGQYTPPTIPLPYPNLQRRLTTMEYQSVLKVAQELDFAGFSQELSSAQERYIPKFQLEGLPPSSTEECEPC